MCFQHKEFTLSCWAIPEKRQTGWGIKDMEFLVVLKKEHVEIPGAI